MVTRRLFLSAALVMPSLLRVRSGEQTGNPLPSWRDGASRSALMEFVARTTRPKSPDWVPPAERIAVFDNDGTLWCEKPIYVQAAFIRDRLIALAPRHPEWQSSEPFRSLLQGKTPAAGDPGEQELAAIIAATHAGMTVRAFHALVAAWLKTARHPRFQKPYIECVYTPMLELLKYLRAKDYKTYIVSGGGVEFMRPWTNPVYGIPPHQVIGSTIQTRYEERNGAPELVRLPKVDFVDDKAGKPVGIHRHIGQRPVMAFGNSDGDFEMLRYTTAGEGPRFGLIVHHTDPEREYAYDKDSTVGRLDRALTEAPKRGWSVVDMKRDWNRIFSWA